MITTLLTYNLPILLTIVVSSLLLFSVGVYFILQNAKEEHPTVTPSKNTVEVGDFAGEDEITTQLDLARAYIETGKEHLAKTILHSVITQGNVTQQEEAQQLLSVL